MKRKPEIVVISDVHLGTYGCHAKELFQYLKSIKPDTLILNGDFIDMWQFSKHYFPKEHLLVLNRILKMSLNGTRVYYITGNHDDVLRNFSDLSIGDFHLRDSLSLQLNGKKYWFFHGDIFDTSVIHLRWMAKMGGYGYDFLVRMNKVVNKLMQLLGRERLAFSKLIKLRVKEAVKYINNFEECAIELARRQGLDYVVCGHVHTPQIRASGSVTYLNSGDWVENLTALEYNNGVWQIYQYHETDYSCVSPRLKVAETLEQKESELSEKTIAAMIANLMDSPAVKFNQSNA